MSTQITELVTLDTVTCYKCAVVFAMPAELNRYRLENGGNFWCPNGHEQHYCKSKVQRLEETLEQRERELRSAKCDVMREQHLRDKAERKLKRIKNGTCPCCKRNFQNLQRHMKTKHPDFLKSKTCQTH